MTVADHAASTSGDGGAPSWTRERDHAVRRSARGQRRRTSGRPGEIVGLIGPERRRQDDVLQLPHRPVPADHRARSASPGRRCRRSRGKVVRAGHGADVPEHPAVPQHDRAGERDGRPVLPHHAPARSTSVLRGPKFHARRRRARERAQELLDFVGLGKTTRHLARNLPYGDQRRLEIARALATDPKLLLLDEPTAGMNPQETRQAEDLIFRIRDLGLAVVVIEHDMRFIFNLCDRVLVPGPGARR